MIVMKFGGTSVEDEVAIDRLATIVESRKSRKPVVVVSAMSRVTDSLLSMSKDASAGALPQALRALRQLRQRHLNTLATLTKKRGASDTRDDIRSMFESMQQVLR